MAERCSQDEGFAVWPDAFTAIEIVQATASMAKIARMAPRS
jgi:hypothetical protein